MNKISSQFPLTLRHMRIHRSLLHSAAQALLLFGLSGTAQAESTLVEQLRMAKEQGVWVVQQDQTLSGIASALAPDNPERRQRLIRAIFEANKAAAFHKSNPHFLVVGKRLQIPALPLIRIGQVDLAVGEVTAKDLNDRRRTLKGADPVYEGDVLVTVDAATLRVRFDDGALMEVRPRTEVRLVDYQYSDAPGAKRRLLVELIKGGLRSISGLIGKQPGDENRVITPYASMGVRGTDFGALVCSEADCLLNDFVSKPQYGKGSYAGVRTGKVRLANQAGAVNIGQNQFFHVESATKKPDPIPAPRGFFGAPYRSGPQSACWSGGKLRPCVDAETQAAPATAEPQPAKQDLLGP